MDTDYTRRPVTPPEENGHKRKSAVLADLNDNKMNDAEPTSVRSAKPFSHNTAKTHDAAGAGKTGIDDIPSSTMKENNNNNNNKNTTAPSTTTTATTLPSQRKTAGIQNEMMSNKSSYDMQRNDVTRRIERDVYDLLQWKNPVRSGATLAIIVGSIMLTRSYSLLQLGAALLTVAIGLNLIYVTFVTQTQKVFSEGSEVVHPYRGVIGNKEQLTTVDKRLVHHYSSLGVDIAETVIRALARIVFIEDSMTSLKWFAIFYVTWAISAHLSSRTIILFFVISAFIFPRLYMSNKGIVDSHLMQGEAILKQQVNNAQTYMNDNMGSAYAKTRAYFAKAHTTGTDAKNSMSNTSVAAKKEE